MTRQELLELLILNGLIKDEALKQINNKSVDNNDYLSYILNRSNANKEDKTMDLNKQRILVCTECRVEFDEKEGSRVTFEDGSETEVFSPCCEAMSEEVEYEKK